MRTVFLRKVACWCLALLFFSYPGFGLAADPPVPAEYQDLFTFMDSKLNGFISQVTAQCPSGGSQPVIHAAELLNANGNRGLQLLGPTVLGAVDIELSRLQALGVQAVTIPIGFPLLYEPFYTYNGNPQDYSRIVNFFQQVAAKVKAKGMKLNVESQFMFTGFYSQGSGFNLAGYYPTFSGNLNQLTAAKAQNSLNVANLVQPDYLNLGAEPDTAANITGQPALNTPSGAASMVSAQVNAIKASGPASLPLGAGIGTWINNGPAFISAYGALPLDFIDLHVYPVNNSFLGNILTYASQIKSFGKKVTINEAWSYKVRDSELTEFNSAVDPTLFSRDAFSFWEPIDRKFIGAMIAAARCSGIDLVSLFWSKFFYAYLDHAQYGSLQPAELIAQSATVSGQAMAAGQYSSTGTYYQSLIAGANPFPTSPPVISSVASGNLTPNAATITWTTDKPADSQVEYGQTTAYGTTSGLSSSLGTSHTVTLSGLAANTTYHFRARSRDASGNLAVSGDGVFTTKTQDLDLQAPTVPGNLAANALSANQISLSWSSSSDNLGVVGYQVFRNSSLAGNPSGTSYTDNGLTASTTYSYSVAAVDAAGNVSARSAEIAVKTLGISDPPLPPPAFPPIIGSSHANTCLINQDGTFYLLLGGQRLGITNPGMLYSYGYSFDQSVLANQDDARIPLGPLLTPNDGALVKSPTDPTVFLISGRQRRGFVSAEVFWSLGFQFSMVLTVTAPELESLPVGPIIADPAARHLPGVNINDNGTVYWMSESSRHAYPSVEVYNSWNLRDDYSRVVPANAGDRAVAVGLPVAKRIICGQ